MFYTNRKDILAAVRQARTVFVAIHTGLPRPISVSPFVYVKADKEALLGELENNPFNLVAFHSFFSTHVFIRPPL